MKTKRLIAICCLLAVGAGSAFFGACSKTKTPDSTGDSGNGGDRISSDWETMPENTNENLKYFGYFHSDGFRSQGSYIDEIAGLENSNVLMINSCFNNDLAAEWLQKAKDVKQQAIFSVHGLFEGGQIKVANSATLLSDYEQTLTELKNSLQGYIDDGTLLGFYFDEPAWNGIKEDDFRTVTKWIRDNIPSIKVITTMTTSDIGVTKTDNYPEINASYNEYCTDVMYDSYAAWNDSTRLTYLDKLKSKATNDQWIWGCATGFVDNAEQNDELYRAIKGMYTEAIQEERYAGIVSFSYADGLEGDWGYGMHTFLNNDSDYYDFDLRKLYTDIGREVIGAEPYDYSNLIDLTLVAPTEIYEAGERIELPAAGAVDGLGNVLTVEYTLTSPSGVSMPIEAFTAEESGKYEVSVSASNGKKTVTKTCYISVRAKGEISTFDDAANLSDAGGTDADTWCWPRQIDNTFYRSGGGSLKITPHAKDGTWPRVIFQRNGYTLWDLSEAGSVSMWVYNTSDTAIEGFALMVADEDMSQQSTVYSIVTLQPKTWTEVSISVDLVKAQKPDLDLSKVTVFYGNAASDYQNRAVFYIDDVMINEKEPMVTEDMSFETAQDLARIGGTADDEWSWPVSISSEQAHGGEKSLKITPHATDGTWPRRLFKSTEGDTYNLNGYESVSLWAYFDSADPTSTLGFVFIDGADITVSFTFELASRSWTEMKVSVADILARNASFSPDSVKIYFAQLGGTYTDRSVIYLDDFTLTEKNGETPSETTVNSLGFETDADLARIGGTADDEWSWPVSISSEQAHGGEKSLKITPHATDGTWPRRLFKSTEGDTYNLNGYESVSLWAYFDSADPTSTLGFVFIDSADITVSFTFELASRSWTEIKVSVADILARNASFSPDSVKIYFAQLGGTYTDRSVIYLDDFTLAEKSKETPSETTGTSLGFETDADLARIGNNADDVWTWPVSVSGEQAHGGTKSLKVTVRQDGGLWPNVVFKSATDTTEWDLTTIEKISVWVYFDSDNDMEEFVLKICNMQDGAEVNAVMKSFTLKARTWTQITVTRAEIEAMGGNLDLTKAYVKLSKAGASYNDRSNFYIDDFTVTNKQNSTETQNA